MATPFAFALDRDLLQQSNEDRLEKPPFGPGRFAAPPASPAQYQPVLPLHVTGESSHVAARRSLIRRKRSPPSARV